MNSFREKTIEQSLNKAVKSYGGIAVKLVSPGFVGMPDRLVLLPGGGLGFSFSSLVRTMRYLQFSSFGDTGL